MTERIWGGFEPTLDEILADPIVRTLMVRDRVAEVDIRRQIAALAGASAEGRRVAGARAVSASVESPPSPYPLPPRLAGGEGCEGLARRFSRALPEAG